MDFRSKNTVEFLLNYNSCDPISSVSFAPNSVQFLLISAWDKSVSLMHIKTNELRVKYFHNKPVLDACFQDAVHVCSGGLDNVVKMFDLNALNETVLGSHADAIKVIENCPQHNCILTGSWDSLVKMWDPRTNCCVGKFLQSDKVYTMGICEDKLVVGTKGKKILVWDLRKPGHVLQRRESSLKHQTRCIKCFPNKQAFVVGSIEGRVAVEYLDSRPEIQSQKYAFKCHRIKEDGMEKIYPVNAISFHQFYNTFATGGSDGYVNIWDSLNKKRLCQFHRYPSSVTCLSFCHDGTALAIGCSFVYDEIPPAVIPENQVYIRYVSKQESKLK